MLKCKYVSHVSCIVEWKKNDNNKYVYVKKNHECCNWNLF